MSRYVVLDTETTGLGLSSDKMVEVGCVEIKNNILTGNYLHSYINPGQPNSPEAFAIHGLSDDFLKYQPTFSEIVGGLLSFINGSCLVVHNAMFDINFIDRELASMGKPTITRFVDGVIDTYRKAKTIFAGKRNSLDALCDRLKIPRRNRKKHGALLDAQLLAQLFLGLKNFRAPRRIQKAYQSLRLEDPNRGEGRPPFAVEVEISLVERLEHNQIIKGIDNATAGNCLWEELFEVQTKA
ncbi:DNA polymerase iii, epsilon subunit [Candidatus Tremblaya phenacola PAVE]|nr:DNA polymerase iii, epsilon subunit [Candidatus Tremblaya phenacola PAVE]